MSDVTDVTTYADLRHAFLDAGNVVLGRMAQDPDPVLRSRCSAFWMFARRAAELIPEDD